MGAFFTNLQILGGTAPAATRARLMQAITRWLHEQGMTEVEEGVEPDRSVLVGPEGHWISVYDEATESQDESALYEMAEHLSATLEDAAMTVLVHDSDVLRLAIFDHGRLCAEYDSNPEFSGGKQPKQLPVTEWERFLAHGRFATDLLKVMQEKKLFAEDTLRQVAELMGMDADQVSIGYNYAEKEDPRYAALRFRSTVRPPSERSSEGPPRFEAHGWVPALDLSVGTPLRAGFSVRNTGRSSKGVAIVCWGDALEKQSVVVRDATVIVGRPAEFKDLPVASFVERASTKDGPQVWVASFPDIELPAGVQVPSGAFGDFQALARLGGKKMLDAMARSNVHANITGDVLVAGQTELRIGFVPLEAPDAGQFGYTSTLRISPKSRRPLRCAADVDGHLLRPLHDRTILFGLASCSSDLADAALISARLIEEWGSSLFESGKYSITVFRAESGARPKTGSANAKAFFRSARWRKLKEELANEAVVTATRKDGETFDREAFRVRRWDGFAFGRSIIPLSSRVPDDDALPTLALWRNVDGQSEASIEAARELLVKLLDEFVSHAKGVQALVGKWGWQPSNLDTTPYESACGVHGQCTLLRSWLTRYLRGVTDDWIWLGPSLREQLGSAAIEEVATSVPVAGGIRLRLRPGASLDDLEVVLAPVLPASSDWKAAVDRYYGRS